MGTSNLHDKQVYPSRFIDTDLLCPEPFHYWGTRWGPPWRCYSNSPKRLKYIFVYRSLRGRTNCWNQAPGWVLTHRRCSIYSPDFLGHVCLFRFNLGIREFLGISRAATVYSRKRGDCSLC